MQEDHHPDARIVAALWVGSPQTVQESGRLYQWLLNHLFTDSSSPGPVEVFEERMMPIEELIEALTDESVFVESAVFQAQKKGITEASMAVLFFSASGKSLWPDYPPDGELAYLGLFAYPAYDAYKE
jgi:hypothetical protein